VTRGVRFLLVGVIVVVLVGLALTGYWVFARQPVVGFRSPLVGNYFTLIEVDLADPVRPLREYRAELDRATMNTNGTSGIDPLDRFDGPGWSFRDRDEDGQVSGADVFQIGWSEGGSFSLRLYWNSRLLASTSWEIEVPVVVLSPAQLGEAFWFNVTDASLLVPLLMYSAAVRKNDTEHALLDPLVNDTLSNGTLLFLDRDGDGNVSTGDRFLVNTGTSPARWDLIVGWGFDERNRVIVRQMWTTP